MNDDEIASRIARYCFDGLSFQATEESLSKSFLALAWAHGVPYPEISGKSSASNPWSGVTIRYHFEEALAQRYLALEAEFVCGFVSYVMDQADVEEKLPVKAAGITSAHVLNAMAFLCLELAEKRARIAGSPGTLHPDEATAIFASRASHYKPLITALINSKEPVPTSGFQLGLSREHPWTAPVCIIADNICETLALAEIQRPLVTILMETVVSSKRLAFNEAIRAAVGKGKV